MEPYIECEAILSAPHFRRVVFGLRNAPYTHNYHQFHLQKHKSDKSITTVSNVLDSSVSPIILSFKKVKDLDLIYVDFDEKNKKIKCCLLCVPERKGVTTILWKNEDGDTKSQTKLSGVCMDYDVIKAIRTDDTRFLLFVTPFYKKEPCTQITVHRLTFDNNKTNEIKTFFPRLRYHSNQKTNSHSKGVLTFDGREGDHDYSSSFACFSICPFKNQIYFFFRKECVICTFSLQSGFQEFKRCFIPDLYYWEDHYLIENINFKKVHNNIYCFYKYFDGKKHMKRDEREWRLGIVCNHQFLESIIPTDMNTFL